MGRGDTDSIRLQGGYLFDGNLIIPFDHQVCAQLSKILDQVVSEGVVVIQDQKHK